jgi:hypothetical protein
MPISLSDASYANGSGIQSATCTRCFAALTHTAVQLELVMEGSRVRDLTITVEVQYTSCPRHLGRTRLAPDMCSSLHRLLQR